MIFQNGRLTIEYVEYIIYEVLWSCLYHCKAWVEELTCNIEIDVHMLAIIYIYIYIYACTLNQYINTCICACKCMYIVHAYTCRVLRVNTILGLGRLQHHRCQDSLSPAEFPGSA